MKESIPAFSGLKEEIVSKPVIVKIGSIEVSGSYFTLERFLLYPLTSGIFFQPVNVKKKKLQEITFDKILFSSHLLTLAVGDKNFDVAGR